MTLNKILENESVRKFERPFRRRSWPTQLTWFVRFAKPCFGQRIDTATGIHYFYQVVEGTSRAQSSVGVSTIEDIEAKDWELA